MWAGMPRSGSLEVAFLCFFFINVCLSGTSFSCSGLLVHCLPEAPRLSIQEGTPADGSSRPTCMAAAKRAQWTPLANGPHPWRRDDSVSPGKTIERASWAGFGVGGSIYQQRSNQKKKGGARMLTPQDMAVLA